MVMPYQYFDSLEKAMQYTLLDINDMGYTVSPRGRESKELIGYGYTLSNPRNRICGLAARDLNPFYLVGNLLWVLRQSNKLDIINYYNPKGSMFSDDGEILRGAYGKRIFDFDGVNQWHQCIKELKCDPDSRRPIITFHLPQHDWSGSLDTPCTASIQFLIREGKLNMINHMRSQSAAFVQPYDVFLMTMLQELLATDLGVELGDYDHFCGSYHYFTNEQSMVDKIVESDDYTPEMPKMVGGMDQIKKLLLFEQIVRMNAIQMAEQGMVADFNYLIVELNKLALTEYWYSFGEVLLAKALHFTSNTAYYQSYVKCLTKNPFQKLLLQVR